MQNQTPDKDNIGPKVEAVERDGFVEIIIMGKAFLRDAAREFQNLTGKAISENVKRFLINYKSCQYISSEGLGCVAEFWRQCSEKEDFRMVSLFSAQPMNELLNFFEIIGLARVMEDHIFTGYDEAVNALKDE